MDRSEAWSENPLKRPMVNGFDASEYMVTTVPRSNAFLEVRRVLRLHRDLPAPCATFSLRLRALAFLNLNAIFPFQTLIRCFRRWRSKPQRYAAKTRDELKSVGCLVGWRTSRHSKRLKPNGTNARDFRLIQSEWGKRGLRTGLTAHCRLRLLSTVLHYSYDDNVMKVRRGRGFNVRRVVIPCMPADITRDVPIKLALHRGGSVVYASSLGLRTIAMASSSRQFEHETLRSRLESTKSIRLTTILMVQTLQTDQPRRPYFIHCLITILDSSTSTTGDYNVRLFPE